MNLRTLERLKEFIDKLPRDEIMNLVLVIMQARNVFILEVSNIPVITITSKLDSLFLKAP